MNYRGISLLSCIIKLNTSFLNKTLIGYLENNDILADEQTVLELKGHVRVTCLLLTISLIVSIIQTHFAKAISTSEDIVR
jgi:hypothetical protein